MRQHTVKNIWATKLSFRHSKYPEICFSFLLRHGKLFINLWNTTAEDNFSTNTEKLRFNGWDHSLTLGTPRCNCCCHQYVSLSALWTAIITRLSITSGAKLVTILHVLPVAQLKASRKTRFTTTTTTTAVLLWLPLSLMCKNHYSFTSYIHDEMKHNKTD